jgi:hypothetical protein
MPKKIEMTGIRSWRLLVLRESELRKDGQVQWVCACACGNEAIVSGKHIRSAKVRSCGCLAMDQCLKNIPDNKRPIGFKKKVAKGYIEIKTERGFVREHVFVMESHLQRGLLTDEIVHHIDENKSNNELSNLELMNRGEHTRKHHVGVKRAHSVGENISKSLRDRSKVYGHIGRKLTAKEVIEIRKKHADRASNQAEMARLYGVTPGAISAIIKHRTWVNV